MRMATDTPTGCVMDAADRLERVEDALVDLATLITEGTISRPAVLVGPEGTDASKRFLGFVEAIREERRISSELGGC